MVEEGEEIGKKIERNYNSHKLTYSAVYLAEERRRADTVMTYGTVANAVKSNGASVNSGDKTVVTTTDFHIICTSINAIHTNIIRIIRIMRIISGVNYHSYGQGGTGQVDPGL